MAECTTCAFLFVVFAMGFVFSGGCVPPENCKIR